MADYSIGGSGSPVSYPLDADQIANGSYTPRQLPFAPAGAHAPANWGGLVAEDIASGTPTAGRLPYSAGPGAPPVWGAPTSTACPISNFGVGLIDVDSINAFLPTGAYFCGSRIWVPEAISITSITTHLDIRAAGSSQAAIYASTGTQLALSALLPMAVDGFGIYTFAAAIPLAAGASYFVAFWFPSANQGIRGYQTGFTASGTFQNRFAALAAALPSPLGTPAATRISPWYVLG